ncbi:MAG: UDP-N-acetylmuramate dehydrogenase [Acidobacteria bacterium]|jgi:UDP-N-acetylenolpyruvoylglucosamine reductase|nr:UDP-N-acetylmuramate dehydrogenase [Acidobacteriota bacterium]
MRSLVAEFGERVRAGDPLAPLTTFQIGGLAALRLDVASDAELARALAVAHAHGVSPTILGGGSNVLVGDDGVAGLVLRVRTHRIDDEGEGRVRVSAGVTINGLVRWLVGRGYRGLEAWAGTPGTMGGAICGNAHFRGALIGDLVSSVRLLTPRGQFVDVARDDMAFGYDASRVQGSGDVVVSAVVIAEPGDDPARLRDIVRTSLSFRKATQPLHLPSAGCIFRNPDRERDGVPAGVPCSAGALIDRVGLKGAASGGARISPVHANFFVNEGGARAADVLALIDRARTAVHERFGVELREEIVRLGC